jgi:hypothetical protein
VILAILSEIHRYPRHVVRCIPGGSSGSQPPFCFCPAPSAFTDRNDPIRLDDFLYSSGCCFELADAPLETGHGDLTAPRIGNR